MITFTSTEAKQNFGKLTDTAMVEPVSITRQGRVILELMTPAQKEKIIQERIKELVFGQFVEDAIQAHRHYEATGLHTTQEEMQSWVQSLLENPNSKPPVCHK